MDIFIGISGLAVVVQGVVEGITSTVTLPEKYNELIKRGLAFLFAVLFCFGFNVDYSADILGNEPLYAWVGYLFTALIIGFGSSVLHKFVKK